MIFLHQKILLRQKLSTRRKLKLNKNLVREFDDDSFDEIEEMLRDMDPEYDSQTYFPLEDSKPPHY